LAADSHKKWTEKWGAGQSQILRIKIEHQEDAGFTWSQEIKEAVDFIADEERVLLTGGRWMRFNQDYLDALDEYVRDIEVEVAESQFAEIVDTEPEFNSSEAIGTAGYSVADKDYSIFRTLSATPIEAWDLKRGTRVYAVKFGSAQKLGYVCDQATAVLELLRNRAGITSIPDFSSYCLWLGYRAKRTAPASIAESGSIILKQRVERWARKCRELGVDPVIKISRKAQRAIDDVT
jgi:hypothetical protein